MSSMIKESITEAINRYFSTLDGADAKNVYELFMNEVEKPLLESVLEQARGNQSQAARWLGLSRNTVRKLLNKYQLISQEKTAEEPALAE